MQLPDDYWQRAIDDATIRGHFLADDVWRALCINAWNPSPDTRKFAAAVKRHDFKVAAELVIPAMSSSPE